MVPIQFNRKRSSEEEYPRTKARTIGLIILGFALAVAGGFSFDRLAPALHAEETTAPSFMQGLEYYQNSFRQVAKMALPVVVEVNVVNVVQAPNMSNPKFPFNFFFNRPDDEEESRPEGEAPKLRQQGLGSGVIIRRDGKRVYVLTNDHVVGEADEINVGLYDGRQFDAELVGKDSRVDLAVVSFETNEDIPVATLGDSESLEVGDWVLAVGNPLGFESTVTSGIVSAVGRKTAVGRTTGFTDYIQTDAAINQGNSGGALVNIYGEVVGINTWIASNSGGNMGLGFAIPINNARKVIEDIVTKGKVEYGWLGINMGDPIPGIVEDMGLDGKKGAFVYSVFQDSPAWKDGILPGDLILAVNNESIDDSDELLQIVARLEAGRTSTFRLIREGREMTVRVKTTAREDENEIQKQNRRLWPGMTVVEVTKEIRDELDLPRSAEVVIGYISDGTPAQAAGLRSGDVIKEINGSKVDSVMAFYRYMNEQGAKELMFRIIRQDNEFLIGLVK
jgi:serine protease Do